jgi:hypothetical protein
VGPDDQTRLLRWPFRTLGVIRIAEHLPQADSVLGIRTLGVAIVCSPRGLVAAVIRITEHTERDELRERERTGVAPPPGEFTEEIRWAAGDATAQG